MELERKILGNSLSVVDEVPLLIERVASRLDIAQEERGVLNLVLEEALVNVVNYAYPSGVKGDIDLEVRFDEADRALTFIIRDSGKPFDPTLAAEG
ncbi:MAG: ATP-binding protein [Alistipes indistinctus]